ncbi:MAG: TipAS antibiotic-recognition domain-containing protein [Lachnospiraceae bacterium]|nr:TipAS antibiotic-recognition domain-containing protein [Lachnospiraceae bacterium]
MAELHKQWLCRTWKQYSAQAHMGVAEMYTADERFKGYYDKDVTGCAEWLRSAIRFWAEKL